MSESRYALARDLHASIRLNLQHYQWKDGLGYLLHPSIPVKQQENLKIADIGTGTGIWLLDLARDLPASTQLDGFDISTAQYPAKEHLPANVRLSILDVMSGEPPKKLQNQYDIVHIRLFIGVICHGDPMPVLLNLVKLLRPGGYLQWDETDVPRTIVAGLHGNPVPNLTKVTEIVAKAASSSWVARLPDLFIQANLESIHYQFAREHAWQRKLASDSICAVAAEIVSTAFAQDAPETEEMRKAVGEAHREVCEGGYISMPFNVAVGWKKVEVV